MKRPISTAAILLGCSTASPLFAKEVCKPNILFILTDDLGYGDVAVFAKKNRDPKSTPIIATPNLDKMAAEGVRLTDMYCPAPVCAPSRASLLTGVHQGNATIRDNQFDKALENNHTLASVLKQAGYATAAFGKWGLQGSAIGKASGEQDKPASGSPATWPAYPTKRGFDTFFGYVRHRDGHEHYPKEATHLGHSVQVWDNDREIVDQLDGCYTADLWTARAKQWIVDTHRADPTKPFFIYLAYDTPHATTQYPPKRYPAGGGLKGGLQWTGKPGRMINTADGKPDTYCDSRYTTATWKGAPWPEICKRYATSVSRIDDCVGDLLALLKDLKIDDNTLVVFTSDNGPSDESYLDKTGPMKPDFFRSFGPFDGIKRDCWEGGVRMAALARAPGRIPVGLENAEPAQFHDWLPTFTELADIPAPARTDGVSLLPSLTRRGSRAASDIYVEYQGGDKTPGYAVFDKAHRSRKRGQMQLVRLGDFVGVRYDIKSEADPFEVYDVVNDPQEVHDLAKKKPEVERAMHATALHNHGVNKSARRPYDAALAPADAPAKTTPGALVKDFSGAFPWTPKLDALTPVTTRTVDTPDSATHDASLFTGYIEAPVDGLYTFGMAPADAGLLRIHNITVIDADFGHRHGERASGAVRLAAGKHAFRLYLKGKGSPKLEWTPPGAEKPIAIPAAAFSH